MLHTYLQLQISRDVEMLRSAFSRISVQKRMVSVIVYMKKVGKSASSSTHALNNTRIVHMRCGETLSSMKTLAYSVLYRNYTQRPVIVAKVLLDIHA